MPEEGREGINIRGTRDGYGLYFHDTQNYGNTAKGAFELPDGDILIYGYVTTGAERPRTGLIRVTPEGIQRLTFGDRGMALIPLGGRTEIKKVYSDGVKILVLVLEWKDSGERVQHLVRMDGNGVVDEFGMVKVPNPAGVSGSASAGTLHLFGYDSGMDEPNPIFGGSVDGKLDIAADYRYGADYADNFVEMRVFGSAVFPIYYKNKSLTVFSYDFYVNKYIP